MICVKYNLQHFYLLKRYEALPNSTAKTKEYVIASYWVLTELFYVVPKVITMKGTISKSLIVVIEYTSRYPDTDRLEKVIFKYVCFIFQCIWIRKKSWWK